MHSSRLVRLLLVALSAATAAQAAWPENEPAPRMEKQVVRRILVARQASGTGGSASPSRTPTPTPSNPPESSSRPPPQSSSSRDEDPSSSTTERPEESTTSAPPQPTEETITEIITTTNSDGQVSTFTSETKTTRTPGLSGGSNNGSSGLSPGTRNTIIGVVVGVGGAIILGALAFVAWRVWGRKKQVEENDGLMGYGGGYTGNAGYAGTLDKSEVGSSGGATTSTARNPFQQTLETYHAPTQVNPSANF